MSAAMEKARFKDVSCLAHTLQIVIKDSVFNQKEVSNVITICRRLVGHFKHSVKANKQLKAARETFHMPQKCMIQDEPTRWNSTLHMLQRVLEQRRPLALVNPGLDRTNGIHLTPSQWSLIEAISEILSLFENATLAISNVGETIPIINSITTSLKENYTLKDMTNDFLASLQRRFGNCESDQCYATATILDPRFKTKVFVSNEAVIAAKQHILSEMDKLETSKISALSGEMESSNAANFTVSSNSSTNFYSN
ncbi:hypothetical protein PR048_004535 [Dryococelus australis]|uniref:Zinc finger BED domain-containing protein 4 n=1 Tax=Dryococelus australis TaxID=614101 RepID=A0ABQ9I6P9_9NEOP|nr:hypothetical protein PR048_004535 [Dryococelus australis]